MIEETWKTIDNFPDYQVSDQGTVRSLKKGGILVLRQSKSGAGYKQVVLRHEGVVKSRDVHRLVAKYFVPNPDNKREVNHINGNKMDNRAVNLDWKTPSENQKHAIEIGLRNDKGSNSVNAKLSEETVLSIRALYRSGNYTYKQIGEIYNIHTDYVGLIIKQKRWAHLQDCQ